MSSSQYVLSLLRKRTILLCALIALFTAIVPFVRAFFRVEVDYNEGWNIYNASTVSQHHLLYPVTYAWTSVNYPMLSFWVLAQLHRLTHDYLFTARVLSLLSLIACSFLIAAIVRILKGSRRAATLAGLFCFALFCAHANQYIGMDDPQIFSQVFSCLGLFIYLRNRGSLLHIIGAALLFVIAGSIKHNLLEFPLTVLLDIAFLSVRPAFVRALSFTLTGVVAAAVSVLLNIRFGGPHFLGQLLAPRNYSFLHLLDQLLLILGPILLPFLLAVYTAWFVRKDPLLRIASLFFVAAIVIGSAFSGGSGVSVNALFGVLLAISVLLGLLFSHIEANLQATSSTRIIRLAPYTPLILFVWLGIPLILSGNWNPIGALQDVAATQVRFDEDVAFLRSHPGNALCESLLECSLAAKPYLYDPFNATRLIHVHKLDPNVLLQQINHRDFSVIQTDDPLPLEDQYNSERWDAAVRAAIEANYVPVIEHRQQHHDDVPDPVLYVPAPALR